MSVGTFEALAYGVSARQSLFLTDSCIVDWTAMHAFECLRNRSIGLLAFGMIFSSVGTAAAEVQATSHSSPAASPEAVPGLQWVDWLLIAVYGASTIGLGYYYGRRQRTTREYFVGTGSMNPLLVGVSLFATLLSTISYLSVPGETVGKGPAILAAKLSLPFAYLIVAYLLLPVYMKQRVTSAYELLEARLGIGVRLLGATMFVLLRLIWMSLLVFLAARAMTVMMGIDPKWIPLVVTCTGLVAVIYTSLGGLQAVVITDLMQTILLFGGAVLVIATVTYELGGFVWFPTEWHSNWDSQPLFSFDPKTRVTVFGTVLTMLIWYVCTAGGDQTSVQRFMATSDVRAARRAYATQLCVSLAVTLVLGLVGLALLGYAEANPDHLPSHVHIKDSADDLFPWYIAYRLPMGISGLVVSAMFAAAMSSIDSGVNSITAVVMTDFLDRFGWRPKTEKGHVLAARLLAFSIGVIVVVGSSFMEHVPGNITAVTQKTNNLLVAPLFALFFFALFVPFAKPAGVLVGAVCGITSAVLIAFSGPLFGFDPETGWDPVSFQWVAPVSLAVNLLTGTIVSLVLPSSRSRPARI